MSTVSYDSTIYNPLYECMPREEIEALQLRRLKDSISRTYNHVSAFREKCQKIGVTPLDLQTLADLKYFPFLIKADFRDNYPFGLFAVPKEEVVRIHSSSGTTGKPTVVGYTANDISLWSQVTARSMGCAGVTRKDVVQICYGYGLFTGGLGVHYGAERYGAMVIPISGGNTKRQVMIMQDFGSTVIASTPSYALYMAEVAEEMGVLDKINLRVGIFGAEPWSESMRQDLQRKLGIRAIDIYGMCELIGPGVSCECECQQGLHIFEDHFYPEIIDPDTGEVLPQGSRGELVITSLSKEAVPVIRYRTRDITSLNYERCSCGRTMVRMDRVTGRTDDMLIIRGVNVFPSQVEDVLINIEGTAPHYQLHVRREGTLDEVELWVEVTESVLKDDIRTLESLSRRIAAELHSVLNISCRVKLVEPKTIERSEGKAKRVIDHRKI
ncbi:MAG TPA: phenylacetate--CoA ligase [Armatimonadota bacterium]|nr:phenylacetate--CoA ligase [Armatimonadota bacterium]